MKSRVVIHHSLTPDGDTLSYPAIRRYHIDQRGWREIAYHLVVERMGGDLYAILGRALDETGAHAPGANRDSIGVCIVGNFTRERPDDELLAFAANHVAGFCRELDIEPNTETIVGHRDVTPGRTCPGEAFPMREFVAMVRRSY